MLHELLALIQKAIALSAENVDNLDAIRQLGEDCASSLIPSQLAAGYYQKAIEWCEKLSAHANPEQSLSMSLSNAWDFWEAYDLLGNQEKALKLCDRIKEAEVELPPSTRERIERIHRGQCNF